MEQQRFKKLLRGNGNFITNPRMRLFAILQAHPALTLKELIKLLDKHDQVTVYRNIELFEKLGVINRLRLGWQTKIELSDMFRHHHHHFTCASCGRVVTLPEDKQLEERLATLAGQQKLQALEHHIEIRGLCPACQKAST